MKAKMSAYNLFIQHIDSRLDPPMQLKPANNIDLALTGEIDDYGTRKHFPQLVKIRVNEYALDISYDVRILCDKEYLVALISCMIDAQRST